jgi:hypothetical protein
VIAEFSGRRRFIKECLIYRLTIIDILEKLADEIGNTFLEIDNRLQKTVTFREKTPEEDNGGET